VRRQTFRKLALPAGRKAGAAALLGSTRASVQAAQFDLCNKQQAAQFDLCKGLERKGELAVESLELYVQKLLKLPVRITILAVMSAWD
jgi:hypothetical protein